MSDFLDFIGMIGIDSYKHVVTGVVRILLATFLGALIGLERGRKHRPAGLRTHTLVCVASALVMVTNEQLILQYGYGDPTRMGAQVISGIGFLGAGTILTDRQNRVRGLTTAAGLWASACIGLAIGGGFYTGGILGTILILIIFTKFMDVEQHFIRRGRVMDLYVSFDGARNLNNFISELTSYDCKIISFEYVEVSGNKMNPTGNEDAPIKKVVSANLQISLPTKNYHSDILKTLENSKGMISMEER
ncbi:MAG: MgtC/SapB family protein [Lachnospirales bacterium]